MNLAKKFKKITDKSLKEKENNIYKYIIEMCEVYAKNGCLEYNYFSKNGLSENVINKLKQNNLTVIRNTDSWYEINWQN